MINLEKLLEKLLEKEHHDFEIAVKVTAGIDLPKSLCFSEKEHGYIIIDDAMKQDEATKYLLNVFNFGLLFWCMSKISDMKLSKSEK